MKNTYTFSLPSHTAFIWNYTLARCQTEQLYLKCLTAALCSNGNFKGEKLCKFNNETSNLFLSGLYDATIGTNVSKWITNLDHDKLICLRWGLTFFAVITHHIISTTTFKFINVTSAKGPSKCGCRMVSSQMGYSHNFKNLPLFALLLVLSIGPGSPIELMIDAKMYLHLSSNHVHICDV